MAPQSKKHQKNNKKQKLAASLEEKYLSAVFDQQDDDHCWEPDERLKCLQCYQTHDTFLHTSKTTGENFELDIEIAICYFPLCHAYIAAPAVDTAAHDDDGRFYIEFDLLLHKESVRNIMRLYGIEPQLDKIRQTSSSSSYSCLSHKDDDYIHYRDLIAYLYDNKLPVDAIGKPLQQKYEKVRQDGSKTSDGVQEAVESIGLAESITDVWRKHWQRIRPDQVDIYRHIRRLQESEEQSSTNTSDTVIAAATSSHKNQMAYLEAKVLKELQLERLTARLHPSFALQAHQQYGIRWMYLREQIKYFGVSGGILADYMGSGKTLQCLSLIVLEPNCCQLEASVNLVVCKLSVLHQWKEEASKFFPGDDMDVLIYYNGGNNVSWDEVLQSAKDIRRITVVLSTYDQIREQYQKSNKKSWLFKLDFHRVICDEGHQIANANSATALAISSLKASHRWILSGSPYRNSPRDLFSLMVQFLRLQDSFLDEERFGRKARWNRSFTRMDAIREFEETGIVPKFNFSPYSIRDEARIESWLNVLMLRRMQSDHATDLPERVNHEHTCAFESKSEEYAIYEHVRSAVENFVLQIYESGESFSFTSVHGGVMLLRRICVSHDLLLKDEQDGNAMWKIKTKREGDGPVKHLTKHHLLQALPRHLKTYLENHKNDNSRLTSKVFAVKKCLGQILARGAHGASTVKKIVAFSQWSGVLDIMENLVETFFPGKLSILRIDGATPGKIRMSSCNSFNTDESLSHILLLNYKAAGEGLNLQRGQDVLLLDPWFTPSVEDQAIARVHRQGNVHDMVHVHRFVVERSIEQRVQQISDRKRSESQRLLSMGLVHRARMVQNTIDLSKDAILDLIGDDAAR